MKHIGWSIPFPSSLINTVPALYAVASTSNLKGIEKLGAVNTGELQSNSYTLPTVRSLPKITSRQGTGNTGHTPTSTNPVIRD